MTISIISTMTNGWTYKQYQYTDDHKTAIPVRSCLIKGGANVISKTPQAGEMIYDMAGRPMWLSTATVTRISDEDYEWLKEDEVFKHHIEKGVIRVVRQDLLGDNKAIGRIVKEGMEKRDKCAPFDKSAFKQYAVEQYKLNPGTVNRMKEFSVDR